MPMNELLPGALRSLCATTNRIESNRIILFLQIAIVGQWTHRHTNTKVRANVNGDAQEIVELKKKNKVQPLKMMVERHNIQLSLLVLTCWLCLY